MRPFTCVAVCHISILPFSISCFPFSVLPHNHLPFTIFTILPCVVSHLPCYHLPRAVFYHFNQTLVMTFYLFYLACRCAPLAVLPFAILLLYHLPFCRFTIHYFASSPFLPFSICHSLAPFCRLSFTILPSASLPLRHLPFYHAFWGVNHFTTLPFYHFPFTIFRFTIRSAIFFYAPSYCTLLYRFFFTFSAAARWPCCRLPFCHLPFCRFTIIFLPVRHFTISPFYRFPCFHSLAPFCRLPFTVFYDLLLRRFAIYHITMRYGPLTILPFTHLPLCRFAIRRPFFFRHLASRYYTFFTFLRCGPLVVLPFAIMLFRHLQFCRFTVRYIASLALYHFSFCHSLFPFCRLPFTILPLASLPFRHLPFLPCVTGR